MCKLCIDCHDLFIELLIVQLFSAASVFVYCLYMNDNVKTIQINMKDNHSHYGMWNAQYCMLSSDYLSM